jgi:tRNA(Ile)-lysidine synthase
MEGQAKKRFEELALPQEGEQAEKGVLRIHANGFCQEPEVMQEYILWICLEELSMGLKDLGAVHLEDLRRLAKNQSGREIHLPDGRRVSRQGDALVFEKAGKTAKEEELGREDVTLPIPGRIRWGGYQITATLEPYKKQIIPQKKCTKWLDYGRIKGKIQVRRRRSGDYFFADGGHKKLKKYFIDEKIPRQERDQIPLLAEEDHILWIVGHRISDGCKVSERTEMLLKVQITEEEEDGR